MTSIKVINTLLVLILLNGCGGSGEKAASTTNLNTKPIAIAGDDVESYISMTVLLDGGASFDPENSALTYSWLIIKSPENSNGWIRNADTKNPQFMSTFDGDYVLQLTVTDEKGVSSQDDINITLNKLAQKDTTLLTQELIDNKAKWESKSINHYQIEQLLSRCCGGLDSVPVTMQVQGEDKTLLYYNPNINWSIELILDRPMIVPNSYESSFKSVKELFDYIETAITGADEVTVSYHSQLGYPQNVIIDWDVSSHHDESGFTIANLINLSDVDCDDIEKGYPSIKLNVVDENTAEPINCDVLVEWENSKKEPQQLVNEDFLYIVAFGIIDDLIGCYDNSPFLVADELGLISLTIAKAGYSTKTVEHNISGEDSCGLIPTNIEVKLEPVN